MKKAIAPLMIIMIGSFVMSSCVKDDDCKVCKQNTYKNGSLTNEGTGVEYCGDELTDIETSDPVTINGVTTQYDCE